MSQNVEQKKEQQESPQPIAQTKQISQPQQQRPKLVLGGPGGVAWLAGENPPPSAP